MRTILAILASSIVASFLIAPAASAATIVDFTQDGALLLGTTVLGIGAISAAGASSNDFHGHDGVSFVEFALPAGLDGNAFALSATGGGDGVFGSPDFDLQFYDASGDVVAESFEIGDEAGSVPSGAASVGVFLFDGSDATFRFQVTHEEA